MPGPCRPWMLVAGQRWRRSTVRTLEALKAASAITLLLPMIALTSTAARASEVEFLSAPDTETLELPFSEAVRVGDMLYLSGQVGNRPGELAVVPGGLAAEARQVMDNIRAVLERHGAGMEDIVKCTVMIDDIDQWGDFNEVYVTYFPGPKPARSAFGADGLALGAALEVECWAHVGD